MSVKGKNRLTKEIKDIQKLFKVELVNNSIDEWFVSNDKATLHIKFPSDYPFSPPFIYIKKQVFSSESKYITSEGAICLEYLTPSIWSPTYSIEGVLVQIFSEIINPGIIKENKENNITDAILSYEKLAIGNGWVN
jgi:ubiquitin-protein ligase